MIGSFLRAVSEFGPRVAVEHKSTVYPELCKYENVSLGAERAGWYEAWLDEDLGGGPRGLVPIRRAVLASQRYGPNPEEGSLSGPVRRRHLDQAQSQSQHFRSRSQWFARS